MKQTIERKRSNYRSGDTQPWILGVHHHPAIKTLIEMGLCGHFPLFSSEWIANSHLNSTSKLPKKLAQKEKDKVRKMFKTLVTYQSIESKKNFLFGLEESDRDLFIKAFFNILETKVLDQKPCLQ